MNSWLLLPILFPMLAGGLLPLVTPGENHAWRRKYVAAAVMLNTLFVFFVVSLGSLELRTLEITSAINLYLKLDDLSRFFLLLASGIWILVTFYSFEYMENDKKDARFFAFFLLTYGVIMGACLAGNFFTLYLFYELMTLCSYPLVVHAGTPESMKAGAKYLMYSFFGAALTLICFIFVANFGLTTDFIAGGVLDPTLTAGSEGSLLFIFFLAFLGFGCKAYIWPLFDWVPASYPMAPAPVAALLSGVVSKIAVLAIIRVSFYLFGLDFIQGSWVQTVLLCMALLTVFLGSMLAYKEKLFKRRLAYSSVSQLSYVLFGIVLLNPIAFLGAMLHVAFHAIIKVILFLSAGAIAHKAQKSYVFELKGVGKAMPITMWCFTIAAVSLVGIPPTIGFLSKWYLAMGGIDSTHPSLGIFGAGILLISALLTAGYLLSIVADAFFPGARFNYDKLVKTEAGKRMTVPLVILAALCLFLGIFPGLLIEFINNITAILFLAR